MTRMNEGGRVRSSERYRIDDREQGKNDRQRNGEVETHLKILVVSTRKSLEDGEDTGERSKHATILATEELESVWVLLLRHQRTTGAIRIGAHDELLAAHDDEILGPGSERECVCV